MGLTTVASINNPPQNLCKNNPTLSLATPLYSPNPVQLKAGKLQAFCKHLPILNGNPREFSEIQKTTGFQTFCLQLLRNHEGSGSWAFKLFYQVPIADDLDALHFVLGLGARVPPAALFHLTAF